MINRAIFATFLSVNVFFYWKFYYRLGGYINDGQQFTHLLLVGVQKLSLLYFALFIYYSFTTVLNVQLGFQRFYVAILDKVFQFITRNEGLFLDLSGDHKISAHPSALQNGNGYSHGNLVDHRMTSRDEVDCFSTQEPEHWNMLKPYGIYHGKKVPLSLLGTVVWSFSFLFRFGILLPIRIWTFFFSFLLFIVWIINITYTSLDHQHKQYEITFPFCFRFLLAPFCGVLKVHGLEHSPKEGGVCISNHSSPLDILNAGNHRTFSWFGRYREGVIGFVYRCLTRNGGHLWFDLKNRQDLEEQMKKRAADEKNYPIVIYPEGTCTSSKCITRFRKGWFDVTSKVYPFVCEYDIRYGDVFWDSQKSSIWDYIFCLCVNWAVVCDITFLPSMVKTESESSIDFAERVRDKIAQKGKLKKIDIDGYEAKYTRASKSS